MGNLTKLMCPECGGELADSGNGVYKCKGCAKTWKEKEAQNFSIYFKNFEQQLENLNTALDNQEQKRISNLKRALWKQVNAEFVSNVEVERLCKQLQAYSYEDFYANFFLATCGRNKAELGEFLLKTDVYEHFDDIPLILDYLLKALKPEWVMGVSNFIEKIKDIDTAVYHKYRTRFEDEYQKIESYVFEPTLERDVFVAYSSKDMEKVSELVSVLEEKENLSCFVAARNMRHGSGSVENYSELLHTAIDNCQVFVFVSSENSRDLKCDAYREEISYIIEKGNNKPRVEYLIQNYSGKAVERNFTKFFKGHEYCLSPKDVAERVTDILMNPIPEPVSEPVQRSAPEPVRISDPAPVQAAAGITADSFKNGKICAKCKKSNSFTAKFCSDCGNNTFFTTYDEYLASKIKFCARCGTQNNIEDNFCIECGSKEFVATKKAYNNLKAQMAEEERKRKEAEAKAKAEAERKAREEEERRRKEEEVRKRREEAEARARAEAAQRAEQEHQRRLREEEERRRREEEERRRKAEEARNVLLNLGNYKDSGNGYVTFGAYPQDKKASSVTIGGIFDKERGYYLGSDNCLYDMYNGEYYKVEPIKWKVLSRGSELFIASDIILDAHRFDGSSNNYANSEIRKWLNGEFYNKAFNQEQKNKIITTNVDNSVASTGDRKNKYVCSNTSDKIFLLSHKEAEQYYTSNSARQKKGTDYAKARGLYVASNGNSWWWLRSPYYSYSDIAQFVYSDGDFGDDCVDGGSVGVVCALKFKP